MNYDPFDLSRYLTNSFIARCGGTLAEKGGLCVTRAANSLKAKRLEVLSGLGIEVVLDVGANTGQWARELRTSGQSSFPCCKAWCTVNFITADWCAA